MASRARIFRISDIPGHWSDESVRKALSHYGIEIPSAPLRLLPSCINAEMLTAVAAMDPSASALGKITKDPLQGDIFPYEGANLVIDQHFWGLTALAAPKAGDSVVADVIAVHGLSGHAFGSWATYVQRSGQYLCWLSDFLAHDIPHLRVLTYGYESRLDRTTTVSRLIDYRRAFVRDIASYMELGVREPGRPLILMGHSFGGTIISQALQTAKLQVEKPGMAELLRSVAGVFFFGVPHGGLRTAELQNMTNERTEDSKSKLLADLEKDSETVKQLSEFLASLSLDVQFVSLYEEIETPTPVKRPEGGWSRTGEVVMMVDERSALLRVPNEIQIPITGNHNTIIKFSHRDNHYAAIRNHVRKILSTANSGRVGSRSSPSQRVFELMTESRALSPRPAASEPDIFGIAFGLSGAADRVNAFLCGFRNVVAAYQETPDTHKYFGIFRAQCWMFVSWLEVLKASWQNSCTSGIARSFALAPAVGVLTGVLADTVQQAMGAMADAILLKEKCGSFETADIQNDPASEASLANLILKFKACIDQLPHLTAPGHAHHLANEPVAATLATVDDADMLRKLDAADAGLLPEDLLRGARMKLALQQTRDNITSTSDAGLSSSSLWKPLNCIVSESCQGGGGLGGGSKSLVLATYSEQRAKATNITINTPTAAGATASGDHPNDARRLLVGWTVISRRWKPLHVTLCRSRIEKLVRQLSIRDKPVAARVLRAAGLVEDFRDERNKRLGILYELPAGTSTIISPVSLQDLLPADADGPSPFGEPLLSSRFRLAHVLATAVHELHRVGWLHKELSSANIAFLHPAGHPSSHVSSSSSPSGPLPDAAAQKQQRQQLAFDLAQPYITGFGYARPDTEKVISIPMGGGGGSAVDLFRYPSLRRPSSAPPEQEGQAVPRFRRRFDVYSLGLILLEIGLWEKIATFERANDREDPKAFAERLRKVADRHLGHRMGDVYRQVVLRCLGSGADTQPPSVIESREDATEDLMVFYFGVVKELGKCQCGL